MRELSFSQHWPKLDNPTFTTFRFSRLDKDWAIGEKVRVVLGARSKQRQALFEAEIVGKEPRRLSEWGTEDAPEVSTQEAREDGFQDWAGMNMWFWDIYKERIEEETLNKLTLRRTLLTS